MFGLVITGAATTNAGAGSYEAAISIDAAENTAGVMPDAILITSSGVNLGVTDAVDASAANILNAINIGANNIQTGTGGTVTFARSDAGIVTLTAVDDDATAAITLDAGGAAAIVIGSADVTTFTVTTDGTGTGEVVLPGSSIDAAEIVDIARAISIPLLSFIDCQTDAGALIGFDTTADALADYVNSATDGTGFVIRFDDTGASEDQGSEVCSNFTLPPDYASGGEFRVRALKDAHAGATEVINCAVSLNGAALLAAGTVTTSASASTTYTCTPTLTSIAVNDSVSFYLSITSGTTMDDQVDVAAVEFVYTSTE